MPTPRSQPPVLRSIPFDRSARILHRLERERIRFPIPQFWRSESPFDQVRSRCPNRKRISLLQGRRPIKKIADFRRRCRPDSRIVSARPRPNVFDKRQRYERCACKFPQRDMCIRSPGSTPLFGRTQVTESSQTTSVFPSWVSFHSPWMSDSTSLTARLTVPLLVNISNSCSDKERMSLRIFVLPDFIADPFRKFAGSHSSYFGSRFDEFIRHFRVVARVCSFV